MLDLLLSILILQGAVFTFVGSLGLTVLPDFYTRLHGPTKATTLGVGSLLIASAIYFSTRGQGLSLHEILIAIFLFMTAPASAHLLSKAALHLRLPGLAPIPESVTLESEDLAPSCRTAEMYAQLEEDRQAPAQSPAGLIGHPLAAPPTPPRDSAPAP